MDISTVQGAAGEGTTLLVAAALGALISLHPQPSENDLRSVRAASFLAVAGALMMLVVEGELARAFGLVGASSIVRYRYGLRSGRDATSLILSLGLGMACGAGLIGVAVVGALVISILTWGYASFERMRGGPPREMELEVRASRVDADKVVAGVLAPLGTPIRFVEVEGKEPKSPNGEGVHYRFRWVVEIPQATDTMSLVRALGEAGFAEVAIRELPGERGS